MATGRSTSMKVPAWIKRLGDLPTEVAQEALAETRDFLREEVRRNASKGGVRGLRVRSGALLSSIRTYLKADGKGGGQVSLGMKFYGWVNDQGATIRPKRARRLRFFIPGAGWRSAQQVILPERRFARDALDTTRKQFPRYLHAALERATRP